MSAAVEPPVNGTSVPAGNSVNKLLEYEKIIKIHDEVFAGSHPRLTVPAHALKKVPSRVPEAVSQPQLPVVPPPASSNLPNFQLPGLQLTADAGPPKPTIPKLNGFPNAIPPSLPQTQPAPPVFPGIDPVLLHKSDDLVRAETQLRRQRLERLLKEQFENKRAEARRRPAPQEAKPDIDLSAALSRALQVVKPELPKPPSPHDGGSASDSFDEDSFYSSKAPDSIPEELARNRTSPSFKHQVQPIDVDDLDADDQIDLRGRGQPPENVNSPYRVNARTGYVSVVNSKPAFVPWAERPPPQATNTVDLTAMDLDEDDEPEYSPPEPSEQIPLTVQPEPSAPYDPREPVRRPLRRYSGLEPAGRRYGSPSEADIRMVRNQIKASFVPQSSPVSPLAITKTPLVSQNMRHRKDRHRPQHNAGVDSRSSPEAPVQPIHPRKKRKLDRRADRKTNRRGANGSPEPYIKDEPISPPPFHDKQPLGAKLRISNSARPIYIDDTPIEEVRYLPMSERLVPASPRHPVYDDEAVLHRSEPRPLSRTAVRSFREEPDLRKVASMHNLRAEQPREYIQTTYETPTRMRASSYALDREVPSGQARGYHEPISVYERDGLRDERLVRSPAPAYDEISSQRYERPSMMAPPRRRIIVDEYGNEVVYEMVQPARAPTLSRTSYPTEMESSNETAYVRNRAASVYAEPSERRYVEEMPPPQVTYRRILETPRMAPAESRPLGREPPQDLGRMQRSASVQVVEYPPRQPMYVDDRMEPQRVRMTSARPVGPVPRYEEVPPREVVQGVPSVRPEMREGSVYMGDRSQVRRGFLPAEAPRYRVVAQDGRYYEVRE